MRIIYLILLGAMLLTPMQSMAEPIESEQLFTHPDFNLVRLSPDGKLISVYQRDKKDHYIGLIDRENNVFIGNIAIGYDNALISYHWVNDQQIYIRVRNKIQSLDIIGDIVGGNIRARLIKAEGKLVHILPDEPDKVMFAKRRGKRRTFFDLYIIEVESLIANNFDNAREIKHTVKDASHFIYNNEFKRLITSEYIEKDETVRYRHASLDGNDWSDLLIVKDVDYRFEVVDYINLEKLAVITNKDSDKMVLMEFDIKSQSYSKVVYQHPDYDLTDAGYLPDGQLNYIEYQQHGLTNRQYFDQGREHFVQRISNTFKNQDVYFIDKDSAESIILLYVNGSTQPGEYFIYDSQTDRVNRLLVSFPALEERRFSPSKFMKVTASDGTEIEAFLTLPIGIDHSTLLVMPHGGPISVKENDRFNSEVQFYASRGFAVLRVNFRGSSGFGKAFLEQGVGEFGRLIEEDITAAVDAVTQTHQFNNICSIGGSYGGYSAAMLAIKQPKRYQCVIGSFGIYDLPLLFNASNIRSTEEFKKHIAKTVGEFNENMIDYSPVYLHKQLAAPILLIAGRKDDVADFEHSNRFKYVLERRGHPVESFFYKDAGHGHAKWSGDQHEAALVHDFLMRTLQLKMPDPSKLSDSARKAIAEDYANIALGYNFDLQLENDKAKALEYYRKASDYGHGLASFNIGAYYHSGSEVKPDLAKTAEFYQKSASQEYHGAHMRLGRMYMEGEFYPQDWAKAKEHLEKAYQLDDQPANNIMLGRFYCLAPAVYRDIDRCIELMDVEQYKRRTKKVAETAREESRIALSWIIAEGQFNAQDKARIKELARNIFDLKKTELTLDIYKEGEFEFRESEYFGQDGEYVLIDKSFKVKAKKDEKGRFGMIFGVDVPGIDSYSDYVALAARWVKVNEAGKREVSDSWILYGSPKTDWKVLSKYEDITEAGIWRLEIFDLDQNRLFYRDYQVTPLASELQSEVVTAN